MDLGLFSSDPGPFKKNSSIVSTSIRLIEQPAAQYKNWDENYNHSLCYLSQLRCNLGLIKLHMYTTSFETGENPVAKGTY